MNKLSHLLFFGSMMRPEDCQNAPGCSFSANRCQYELLSNLLGVYVDRVTAICPVPMRSYPYEGRIIFAGQRQEIRPDFLLVSPAFINFGPLKILTLVLTDLFAAIWLCLNRGRPDIILLYNPYIGYAFPALWLGRLWHVPVVIIAADLSAKMTWRQFGRMRRFEARIQHWILCRFDGVMTFSIHTIKDLGITKPYMRFDPGIDASMFNILSPMSIEQTDRALLFSGTLNEANGLRLLLNAFRLIDDPTIQLWISGRGEMEPEVKEASFSDSRIHFLGFFSHKDLIEIMRRARIFVNPRPVSLPEHRYNFPSKILEYLAVGRPVISMATSDIVQEYEDFLFLVKDERPREFARIIETVFAKSSAELEEISKRGQEYVLTEKNWDVITMRVANFLKKLIRG